MCSHCDNYDADFEEPETDELIEEGIGAADNIRFLLDNPDELLEEDDDTELEEAS